MAVERRSDETKGPSTTKKENTHQLLLRIIIFLGLSHISSRKHYSDKVNNALLYELCVESVISGMKKTYDCSVKCSESRLPRGLLVRCGPCGAAWEAAASACCSSAGRGLRSSRRCHRYAVQRGAAGGHCKRR
ncbi:Protein of unknown function [Gryllus bimaculatus]|nr:Protein of unknown function [Gryllus bimaculatus]